MPNFEEKKLIFLLTKQNNNIYHEGRTLACGNPKKCKMIITMVVDYNYKTNHSDSQVFLWH